MTSSTNCFTLVGLVCPTTDGKYCVYACDASRWLVMPLNDIRHEHVLQAIEECNQCGRDKFLEKYGFYKSINISLVHNGQSYDSKAIVGVAHGYARPDLGPLASSNFSGGERSKLGSKNSGSGLSTQAAIRISRGPLHRRRLTRNEPFLSETMKRVLPVSKLLYPHPE